MELIRTSIDNGAGGTVRSSGFLSNSLACTFHCDCRELQMKSCLAFHPRPVSPR